VLKDLISHESAEEVGNKLFLLKRKRSSQLQQRLDQALSVHHHVLSFQLKIPSRVLKTDPAVQVQLLRLQLLHKGTQLGSMLSHACLSKAEAIHDVSLIVLELHHCVLDLRQTVSSVTHVLRHLHKTSLLWETLPALCLELTGNRKSLGLDVVSDQFEDLLDVLEG
jgi:hypothetical protein